MVTTRCLQYQFAYFLKCVVCFYWQVKFSNKIDSDIDVLVAILIKTYISTLIGATSSHSKIIGWTSVDEVHVTFLQLPCYLVFCQFSPKYQSLFFEFCVCVLSDIVLNIVQSFFQTDIRVVVDKLTIFADSLWCPNQYITYLYRDIRLISRFTVSNSGFLVRSRRLTQDLWTKSNVSSVWCLFTFVPFLRIIDFHLFVNNVGVWHSFNGCRGGSFYTWSGLLCLRSRIKQHINSLYTLKATILLFWNYFNWMKAADSHIHKAICKISDNFED